MSPSKPSGGQQPSSTGRAAKTTSPAVSITTGPRTGRRRALDSTRRPPPQRRWTRPAREHTHHPAGPPQPPSEAQRQHTTAQIRDPRVTPPGYALCPLKSHRRPRPPARAHAPTCAPAHQQPKPTYRTPAAPSETPTPVPASWGSGCALAVTGSRTPAGVAPPALDAGGRRRPELEALASSEWPPTTGSSHGSTTASLTAHVQGRHQPWLRSSAAAVGGVTARRWLRPPGWHLSPLVGGFRFRLRAGPRCRRA